MPKKKPSKKIAGKKVGPKKVAQKKLTPKRPARKKKLKLKKLVLEHWLQRPGTFTYDLIQADGSQWVCCATREMSDEDLFMQFALHVTFDISGPIKPGEIRVFNSVDDPLKTFKAMAKNPPPGWLQHAKETVAKHLFQMSGGKPPMLSPKFSSDSTTKTPKSKAKPRRKKTKWFKGKCPNCAGRQWVCEDHPSMPKKLADGSCPCGAREKACPICNPKADIVVGPDENGFTTPDLPAHAPKVIRADLN